MTESIYLVARVQAWTGQPVQRERLSVDADGTVRVYDRTAGHYTRSHRLTERAEARVRRLARAEAGRARPGAL